MSFWSDLGAVIGKAVAASMSGKTTAPILTTKGGATFTVGQAKAALAAGPAFLAALEDIVTGAGTLADVETIGEDALAAAGILDPALAPIFSLGAVALPLLLNGIASGAIVGDPDPEVDANEYHSRGGRGN